MDPLVGRVEELATLAKAAVQARETAASVVAVAGPAGIGKTALLRKFETTLRDDTLLIHVVAEEDEASRDYAAIDQLVRQVDATVPRFLRALIDRPQDPVRVGGAILELIGPSEGLPLVVAVDDAQWLDLPSASAISFAFRRLTREPTLGIFATRDIDSREGHITKIRQLVERPSSHLIRLEGLDARATQQLTTQLTGQSISLTEAERVVEHAAGSPLLIKTLIDELGVDQLRADPAAPLPAPRSYQVVTLGQLSRLPADARSFVSAAAVLGERFDPRAAAAIAQVHEGTSALDAAARAGMIQAVSPQNARFAHPLARSAIYEDLPPAQRTSLHRAAISLATDNLVQLRHRVGAADGDDHDLVADLREQAERDRARGAYSLSASWLLTASKLSQDPVEARSALITHAGRLIEAGDVAPINALLTELDVPDAAAQAVLAGFHATNGDHPAAAAALERGLACVDDRTEVETHALLYALRANECQHTGRLEEAIANALRALEIGGVDCTGAMPLDVALTACTMANRVSEGQKLLARWRPEPQRIEARQPDGLMGAATIRIALDDLETARDLLASRRESLRESSRRGHWILSMATLAAVEYELGLWSDAQLDAYVAYTAAQDAGLQDVLVLAAGACAGISALRGSTDLASSCVETMGAVAGESASPIHLLSLARASADVAYAAGDYAGVAAAYDPLAPLIAGTGLDEPALYRWREHYVEALVALGRLEDAEHVLAVLEDQAASRSVRSVTASARRARGLLASALGNDSLATKCFEEALHEHESITYPFMRALTHQDFADHQRRQGRESAAAHHVAEAKELFRALGAVQHLTRMDEAEAAAAAEHPTAQLTGQEKAVAELVGRGLTNREVAAELFVSPRTVEYHLSNVFLKLGISSRRQLRGF